MAVIKVEEDSSTSQMYDVGEVSDYPVCCGEVGSSENKDKKHYPTLYMYEIPDELYNSFVAGKEVTLTIKAMVKETSERIRNDEDGESTKRTVDLEVKEVSKPQ